MRHLFNAMADHVKTINENVEEVESIPDDKANEFLDDMLLGLTGKTCSHLCQDKRCSLQSRGDC